MKKKKKNSPHSVTPSDERKGNDRETRPAAGCNSLQNRDQPTKNNNNKSKNG